jgi:hypothetical protein
MFTGTLNGLSKTGSVYRRTITAKLIAAKVITTAKTTIFAIITMSPTKANPIDATRIPITATHGVLVFG